MPTPLRADSWAVFYAASAPLEALQRPDLLVLEPDHPWDVRALRRDGQRVLAYLSLGEVNRAREYHRALAAAGALLGSNPDWPGADRVAPDNALWRALVLEQIAPALLAKGYDGLFYDTIDTAVVLERAGTLPGASRAMSALVRELGARFPDAVLVGNGGISLLGETASALSAVAIESVLTDYDFTARRYRVRDDKEARERSAWVQGNARPHRLPVFAVEYVDPAAPDATRDAIAARSRAAGYVPFVAEITLQTLAR